MHEYQDNGCLPDPAFPKKFVQAHVKRNLSDVADIGYLPTPGTKPMLPLVLLACGENVRVKTMTNPGYPVSKTWSKYLGARLKELETNPENQFLFDLEPKDDVDLIMINYPHNPSGQIAPREWLKRICAFCETMHIRIFNDAAYAIIADPEHTTLAEVAVDYKNLSWAEAFSASKAGNFTGWRIGAIVGSPDFVSDISTIKGNTDSGFFAPAAIGIMEAFKNARTEIYGVSNMYKKRLEILIETLESCGMRLAVKPKAGFFSLWLAPTVAFGQPIKNADEFNQLMIERTGIVGVPFGNYIRYAVVGDIEAMIGDIKLGFRKMQLNIIEG
jgi:LL-diaminopimelate aminotransferase